MSENNTIINFNATRSKLITISSDNKTSSSISNSNFHVILPPTAGDIDNIKGCLIKEVSFANIFYNINSYNNVLILDDTVSSTSVPITLTPGQYTLTQFITALQSAINTALSGDSVTVVISNDPIANVLTFTFTGGNIGFTYFDGTTVISTMGPVIGFTDDIPAGSVLTMPYPYNLTGETELRIYSACIGNSKSIQSQPNGTSNLVDVVPITVPFGATQTSNYNDTEMHFISYSPYEQKKSFRDVDIVLQNRNNMPLDLPPNFPFNMVLKTYV